MSCQLTLAGWKEYRCGRILHLAKRPPSAALRTALQLQCRYVVDCYHCNNAANTFHPHRPHPALKMFTTSLQRCRERLPPPALASTPSECTICATPSLPPYNPPSIKNESSPQAPSLSTTYFSNRLGRIYLQQPLPPWIRNVAESLMKWTVGERHHRATLCDQ